MGSIPGRMGGHQPHLMAPSAKRCPATIINSESVPGQVLKRSPSRHYPKKSNFSQNLSPTGC
jgi:hypothetical protein